jgi:hypothetical protein
MNENGKYIFYAELCDKNLSIFNVIDAYCFYSYTLDDGQRDGNM